ncbi:MSHA biogenesis protein MshJ [Shewanella sp. 5_MG-2023]|uniref:MSHA biogenesis protein MshJ n=1 Tax=unclassified Shewanella TaxID=196818 RepID=UPI0026E1DCD6|nr:MULTISPECIES: MSHA biogenesis protein MshJ [unclassified Shewanella]MDO6639850.1 MSHA biogenesis protein MshJ [Shewanella sp. 5_MG-2023]MDO6775455.1 MSHA biogenesis protein MshJ [Shewanella sp. 3_MG-2023]
MKQTWQKLATQFNELSQRERVLIALASIIVVAMLLYFPVETIWKERLKLSHQVTQIESENDISEQQIALYQQRLAMDPNSDYRNRLTMIEQQNQQMDANLESQMISMVPANYMPTVLTTLLGNINDVKLVSFSSIAPQPLIEVGEEDKMNLYSHGIRLTLEGRYFAILKFIQSIEAMPDKLYWKRLDYHVEQHPNATVEIELYTLSINKEFISVAQ